MAEGVYLLCAITSIVCAALLLRRFFQGRNRLLLWSSLCFLGLAANNILLVIDLLVFPSIDLEIWRGLSAFASLGLLAAGLVWDADA